MQLFVGYRQNNLITEPSPFNFAAKQSKISRMKTIHFEEMPQWMAQLDEKVDALTETVRQLYQELAKVPAAPAAPEQMVTIQQAAQILQLSVSRVRTLVQEGRVPCYKPGRNLLFRPSELHQWLTDSRRKGQPSIAEQMEALSKGMRNRNKGKEWL